MRAGVSPHAPYSCSTEVYAACLALGVPVMTHFNESQDELDWLLCGEGPMKPVEPLLIDPDGQSGIGVVGMRERLRLLGGRLELDSAPGGPTVVRAVLPRWTATRRS